SHRSRPRRFNIGSNPISSAFLAEGPAADSKTKYVTGPLSNRFSPYSRAYSHIRHHLSMTSQPLFHCSICHGDTPDLFEHKRRHHAASGGFPAKCEIVKCAKWRRENPEQKQPTNP